MVYANEVEVSCEVRRRLKLQNAIRATDTLHDVHDIGAREERVDLRGGQFNSAVIFQCSGEICHLVADSRSEE